MLGCSLLERSHGMLMAAGRHVPAPESAGVLSVGGGPDPQS